MAHAIMLQFHVTIKWVGDADCGPGSSTLTVLAVEDGYVIFFNIVA